MSCQLTQMMPFGQRRIKNFGHEKFRFVKLSKVVEETIKIPLVLMRLQLVLQNFQRIPFFLLMLLRKFSSRKQQQFHQQML